MDDEGKQAEALMVDRLASGDRPSIYAAGICVANILKTHSLAVLCVDVLGRVHVLPPDAVELKQKPKVSDNDLHSFPEDAAIRLLVQQGDEEDGILAYLRRRSELGIPPEGRP